MNFRYVKSPNLPENNVKTVIIGEIYKDALEKPLNDLGIKVCTLAQNNDLPYPVRAHADMMMAYVGNGEFTAPDKTASKLRQKLEQVPEIHIGKSQLKPEYPWDIAYNILQIGEKCFHNLKYTEPVIIDLMNKNDIELINVRQGYSKCSVCVVSDKAAITSDIKMQKILMNNGIDTLLISEGFIDLDGYNHGFIGGSSGKISKNRIAFTGTLDEHPDKDRIMEFLNMHDVEAVMLTNKRIFDIGSIIPVIEEDGTCDMQ